MATKLGERLDELLDLEQTSVVPDLKLGSGSTSGHGEELMRRVR